MKTILLAGILLAGLITPTFADIKSAKDAYKKGNFSVAFGELQSLASDNLAQAQYLLGVMYTKGQFKAKDDKKSAEWFAKAAAQGHAAAQKKLGDQYRKGSGVPKDYVLSVKWYKKAASQNHAWAQMSLGSMYEQGWGVKKDLAKAVKWRLSAAKMGNPSAQFRLGYLYENGTGVSKNIDEALKWYRKAAKKGFSGSREALARLKTSPPAENTIPRVNYRGITLDVVPPNPKAKYDIKLVSTRVALDKLRNALDYIYKVSPFSAAAIEELKANGTVYITYDPGFQPSSNGMVIAAFFPDYFQKDGKDDIQKSFVVVVGPHGIKWPTDEFAGVLVHELVGHGMQKLRDQTDFIRVLDLECTASLYEEKFYQESNRDKSLREAIEFRQALEGHWCSDFKKYQSKHTPANLKKWDVLNPDVPALIDDFNIYAKYLQDNGIAGKAIKVAQNFQQADFTKWVRHVETKGRPDEFYRLGVFYRDGVNVEQDQKQAIKWISRAAEHGISQAHYDLGIIYENAMGVERDYVKASQMYRVSAESGFDYAQLNLGALYVRGQGVEKNPKEGAKWYLKAAKQGNPIAQTNLGDLFYAGKGVTKDFSVSMKWYLEAAKQSNPTAQFRLGMMYAQGKAGPRDFVQAYRWIKSMASKSTAKSKKALAKIESLMTPEQIAEAQKLVK